MDEIEKIKKTAKLILKAEIKHLQLVPSVAIKLLKMTNDDDAKIKDMSRVIETEPALAAKILRNVNSAAFALPNKVAAINRAVNILGFSSVRRIALAQLFYNYLIKPDSGKKFNAIFFWQHCLFVASLSRRIAVVLKHPEPDLVYTAGLIHDIGKVVLENYGRLSYSDFIAAPKKGVARLDEERTFFGLNHSEIGQIFCLEWQMPEPITAVVACHHAFPQPTSDYYEFKKEIAIVSFANYIAWMQGIGSTDEPHSLPVLQPEALALINFNQLNLDELLQQVDQEMQNINEFYGIQFPAVNTLRATLVKAALNLSQSQAGNPEISESKTERFYLSSLTAPHQSLNPNDFLPRTLEALHHDFDFDRVMMLTIDPRRRCLIKSFAWPEPFIPDELDGFEINIGAISGLMLDCLRNKKPVLINNQSKSDHEILSALKVNEFIAVPVLNQQRLLGLLYADNSFSKKKILIQTLSEIVPIAAELGIALINARHYEMEKKQAQLDPLTQLYNKRMINHFLAEIFQQELSKLAKFAIGFIDIDKFKLFNDLCGHLAGDEALTVVAEILGSLTRPGDFIGRYGGEEFIFLLNNTDKSGAMIYAERIRKEIERRGKLLRGKFNDLELTVSIGVAVYNPAYTGYNDMIEVADQAMYRAKRNGRNKVVMLSDSSIDKIRV